MALTKRDWWILGGGAVVVTGGIVYLATRGSNSAPAAGSNTATAAAPTIAAGAPGSPQNPIVGQLYGPQGAYGVRDAGGMHQIGQFTKPVTMYGETLYEFVATSSTPLPQTPAAPTQDQLNAQSQANALQVSQSAAASAAAAARAAAQPTAAPAGVTYALVLDSDKSVQLNPGQTLGIRFPPSRCGSTWQIGNSTPAVVSTPDWNIVKADATGVATLTFTCDAAYKLTVQVVDPNLGHLQG